MTDKATTWDTRLAAIRETVERWRSLPMILRLAMGITEPEKSVLQMALVDLLDAYDEVKAERDAARRDLCRATARLERPSEVAKKFGWDDLEWEEHGE